MEYLRIGLVDQVPHLTFIMIPGTIVLSVGLLNGVLNNEGKTEGRIVRDGNRQQQG